MNRVLITGASGLLGRAIVLEFKKHSWEVLGLAYSRARHDLIKVDLNDFDAVSNIFQTFQPHAIIHCAAERAPDKVEKDYEACKKLNVVCTKKLAEFAGKAKAAFVYISTDYVFDGTSHPYKEDDCPNPLNQYGSTKYEGEKEVLRVNSDSCILRIPVLYGDEEYVGESAISSLINHLLDVKPTKISNYEIRFPSHTDDIGVICRQLVTKKLEDQSLNSIFHWCGSESFTKYDMIMAIAEVYSLECSHISPEDKPSSGALRPKNTQLSCLKLAALNIGQHTKFREGVEKSFRKFIQHI